MEDKCCRCCHEPGGKDLIAPCACSGSMKWVHRRCLDTWRAVSPNPVSFSSCEVCHAKYQLLEQGVGSWPYIKLVLFSIRDIIFIFGSVTLLVVLSGLITWGITAGSRWPQKLLSSQTAQLVTSNPWFDIFVLGACLLFFIIGLTAIFLAVFSAMKCCCFGDDPSCGCCCCCGCGGNSMTYDTYGGYNTWNPFPWWWWWYMWTPGPSWNTGPGACSCCDFCDVCCVAGGSGGGGGCDMGGCDTGNCNGGGGDCGDAGAVIVIIILVIIAIIIIIGFFVGIVLITMITIRLVRTHLRVLYKELQAKNYKVADLSDIKPGDVLVEVSDKDRPPEPQSMSTAPSSSYISPTYVAGVNPEVSPDPTQPGYASPDPASVPSAPSAPSAPY